MSLSSPSKGRLQRPNEIRGKMLLLSKQFSQMTYPVFAVLFVVFSHERWPGENNAIPLGRTFGDRSHVSKKHIGRIGASLKNVYALSFFRSHVVITHRWVPNLELLYDLRSS